MEHETQAFKNFSSGYSCAQSVFSAFGDVTEIPEDLALKISSCYGGGISGTKGFCGVLSGALMVLGTLYGNSELWTPQQKKEYYAMIREFLDDFEAKYGSTDCSALEDNAKNFVKEEDDELFQKKPCAIYVQKTVELLDQFINDHPISA